MLLVVSINEMCPCQSYEESVLISNSEKWGVTYKKGTITLSQTGVSQTITMSITKLDSGYSKIKKKDSASLDLEGSAEGWGINQSKFMTIRKNKVYRLQLGNDENQYIFIVFGCFFI